MSKKTNFGSFIQAIITDRNDRDFFAQHLGITYRVIATSVADLTLGDVVEGFAYQNKQNEAILLLDQLPITQGKIILAPVVEVDRQIGAFVDVSLPEKDLLVSADLLPTLSSLWPNVDSALFVQMISDEHGQLWGKLADREAFEKKMIQGEKADHNADFEGRVVALHRKGTYVFDNGNHLIFIHESERDVEPRLGELVVGRVIGLREDGVLYGSFRPRAYEVIADDAEMIYETLKRQPQYKMELHPKSSVSQIDEYFGISKARFKRAISHLYKKRLIGFDQSGTWLIEMNDACE